MAQTPFRVAQIDHVEVFVPDRYEAAAWYQRILRFQRFVSRIDRDRADLATLAAETGYADQAHLTRECLTLSGLTPAALARQRAL